MIQFWTGITIIAVAAALGWWGTQMATDGWSKWRHPQHVSESTALITEKGTSHQNAQQVLPLSNEKDTDTADESKANKSSSHEFPDLERLFRNDFSNLMRFYTQRNIGLKNKNGKKTVKIGEQLYLDFPSKSRFLGYYIPMLPDSYGVCAFMADEYWTSIRDFESKVSVSGGDVTEFSSIPQKDLMFTGRIYIYHEDSFTHQQLADLERLYQSKGLSVVFRGHAYLSLNWKSKK